MIIVLDLLIMIIKSKVFSIGIIQIVSQRIIEKKIKKKFLLSNKKSERNLKKEKITLNRLINSNAISI